MRSPSLTQILIIVLIIIIIFGARRLPDVASSIGKSLKIFKKEVSELREDDDATTRGGTTSTTSATHDSAPEFRPGGDPDMTPNPPGGPNPDHR